MPQMSPLSWILLFIYFIVMLLMFCVMNYFLTYYTTPLSTKKSFNKISLNWKW
uniref:ATP synthase F0 subunit 8 n=1 Tax=Micromus paganus TaxID=1504851 RepID=UPI001BEE2303|nr:ATP synthase F0 subunit 8 [Micromus paganus]QTZ19021.1 ATP synthase F0 subunit 8 [Micromus paganus]